ncbi:MULTISPECIES: putative protein N(5)-glutamine methyltransferase [unclassified Rathayibacter]|uniref:putative protein N(5)-glutamine methyltransferase n=1 Tax=unclassified Rathayibacter TaxID=2609250 RepID=UPI00188D0B17|nr:MULTISPECIES: putative protein N(5)-glutamine methyltransferase [unclassified Rathayibacter]MBF4461077.1 putative protein N(5)-glutamine methyltransferase [Rathayibacter sp. VKM Ac-2879]MBF4502488.1 putative protein N(5)-glutamine methyltransferase [Rathayibacter sp. VKM Ac-2878]
MNDAPSGSPAGRSSSVARLRAAGCVFAEEEAELLEEANSDPAALERALHRREAGEPLEQILGWVAFRGLRVPVTPGVFVPRVRTGFVVDTALSLLSAPPLSARSTVTVLDLCCGTGAIACALAHEAPHLRLLAADLSPTAVASARIALSELATVFEGDLFSALPPQERGRLDLIVVNAPYVPTSAIALMPPEARLHEPMLTLDGGVDGLDLHRRIALEAAAWLAPGGSVVIETSDDQAEASASAFAASGFSTHVRRDEDLDATVVVAGTTRL